MKAAGLGHWTPSELRHSAASLLSAAGVPLEVIADVLGHASTRMLEQHYRHQVNTFVVLLFESAGRWGVEWDSILAAGRPIFEAEKAKREAKELEAAVAKAAPEKGAVDAPPSRVTDSTPGQPPEQQPGL